MYKLGNFVKTKTHGQIGRIYKKHTDFRCSGETVKWFNGLVPKLSKNAIHDRWYSILCDQGGSILVPESDIAGVIEIKDFRNPFNDYYFDNDIKQPWLTVDQVDDYGNQIIIK